jgi:hypothetical protein
LSLSSPDLNSTQGILMQFAEDDMWTFVYLSLISSF